MLPPPSTKIDDGLLEVLAGRVAALLQQDLLAQAGLLSAAQVAGRLGVGRSWVYDHAEELGVVRLGEGPRPRLRFDPAIIADRTIRGRRPGGPRAPVAMRAIGVELLPIKSPAPTRRPRILD